VLARKCVCGCQFVCAGLLASCLAGRLGVHLTAALSKELDAAVEEVPFKPWFMRGAG